MWFMKNIPITKMKSNGNSEKIYGSICQYIWVLNCDKYFKEIEVVYLEELYIATDFCIYIARKVNQQIKNNYKKQK